MCFHDGTLDGEPRSVFPGGFSQNLGDNDYSTDENDEFLNRRLR